MENKINGGGFARIQGTGIEDAAANKALQTDIKKGEFDRILSELQGAPAPKALEETAGKSDLKFSTHAVERMHSRGISIDADEMKRIEGAIKKASDKGAKDTLVVSGDKALIVSTKNNTVVTVMDKTLMKENVFTNIDSTVLI
jgi:flagellar operon protein